MQNPVTGSGRDADRHRRRVRPRFPARPDPQASVSATLISLTLTPLQITDGLAAWDGQSEQVPCEGHAILFGRSIAAALP